MRLDVERWTVESHGCAMNISLGVLPFMVETWLAWKASPAESS